MPQVEEPKEKHTIQDRAEDFGAKTYEQAEAKKVLVRNLKGLMHKVVRIRRKNFLKDVVSSSMPPGMGQPGSILSRRYGDREWKLPEGGYNSCRYGEDFPPLVGMVIGYELFEPDSGGSVYLIVAAPNDRFEYRFDLRASEIEVLDSFPAADESS